MGIGPHSAEEAGKIWSAISSRKMTLEDFIAAYDTFKRDPESKLNSIVKNIKVPLREDMGILALTILEGMPFEISSEDSKKMVDPDLLASLNTNYFVTVPLKAKNKVLGAILVDNVFNKKPITKSDIRMLTMFANHAGLAIENSRLFEETVYLSSIDWLTKLWNYGRFQEHLSYELDKANIENSQLSLVMIDVDNFKIYNDTFGHMAGDEALRRISAILKTKSRKFDLAARYGGEEFGIIMPKTSKENARLFAERIRIDIEKLYQDRPEMKNMKCPTISSGISTFKEDASTKDELISRADLALYEAKRNGKNQTCLYTSGMGESKPS
jgi:diguanylate cyclase (GGDEF)-like protein